MDAESIRFEDVLTQLEIKRQQLEKEKEEIDRLHAKQEEDSRRAREFRAQMERAKENARSRGEAEAKRILADAKSAADAAFRELDELRKAQKKQLDAQAMNEKRVEIVSELNAARERAGVRRSPRRPVPSARATWWRSPARTAPPRSPPSRATGSCSRRAFSP